MVDIIGGAEKMKPILYESIETTFTSQGLGVLNDAISCIVHEERNGKYELEMVYPITGIHWEDIQISRIIMAKPNETSESQAFRIYRISKPLKKQCAVYAEHISYQLANIPVMPFQANSFATALAACVTNAAETCPFDTWTDKTVSKDYTNSVPTSFRAILGGTQNSLLDVFGTAEYEFDNYHIKAWLNRGSDRGVVLRYGKNITDLTQEENIENTVTGIVPFWQDAEGENLVTLPENAIYCANVDNYPYKRTVPYDFSSEFETKPTEAQLRTRAQTYVENNLTGVPDVNIDLSFIPLWQSEEYSWMTNLEHVRLCDTIHVEFELLGVSASAKVIGTDYDVLRERFSKIEIGDAKTTLAKQMQSLVQRVDDEFTESISFLKSYAYEQTQRLSGANGGTVLFKYNNSNQPSGIKFMSAASESTAQYQILINYAGIGFSSDYGATFTNAWTIDGHLNADFITVGSLSAGLITAGVLTDKLGKNSFNLDTGVLTITSGQLTLGTYDSQTLRYPFQVTSSGILTAVTANLIDANISGTITSANGLYQSELDAGYLKMYFDNTLYGQFGGGAWAQNTAKRGVGLYLSENASYMYFGRFESTESSYVAAYIINWGLISTTEISYSERHIFYGTGRFTGSLTVPNLYVSNFAGFSSGLTSNALLQVTAGGIRFNNNLGIIWYPTAGSTAYSFLSLTNNDIFQVGNNTFVTNLIGSEINITASRISIPKLIQSGSFTISGSSGSLVKGSVSFSQSFPGVPNVVITPVDQNGYIVRQGVYSVTTSGFNYAIQANATGSFTIYYIAMFQASS